MNYCPECHMEFDSNVDIQVHLESCFGVTEYRREVERLQAAAFEDAQEILYLEAVVERETRQNSEARLLLHMLRKLLGM